MADFTLNPADGNAGLEEGVNYNPLTAGVTVDAMFWIAQFAITILNLIQKDCDRDETGVIPTKYQVDPRFIDIDCIATGGGISAAMKNERWEQDQQATFITKYETGAKTGDAVLFARNVFVIDSVSPVGTIGVAWEIHAMRVVHPDEGIRALETAILYIQNGGNPGYVVGGDNA